jgi:hypothetical protein
MGFRGLIYVRSNLLVVPRGLTFFMNGHCNIKASVEGLFRRLIFDKFNLRLLVTRHIFHIN